MIRKKPAMTKLSATISEVVKVEEAPMDSETAIKFTMPPM
jgi:hypothetical protein